LKSDSMMKHFHTLQEQRAHYMPSIHELSQKELWYRSEEGKWSIGEHFYHLYLILRMLKTATKCSLLLIPTQKCEEISLSPLKYMIFTKNISTKKEKE